MKLRFRVARKNGDIEALADAMRALKNLSYHCFFCSFLWIVEILKKLKTKMLSFYKQKTNFSQIVSKRSQNNNIILDISI